MQRKISLQIIYICGLLPDNFMHPFWENN